MKRVLHFCLLCIALQSLEQIATPQSSIISTIAGGGDSLPPISGPAVNAVMGAPAAVASDRSGGFYVLVDSAIYHVGSDGIIRTAASVGFFNSDLPPNLRDMAVDAAGNLYIAHIYRVYRLSVSGEITIVAGGGNDPRDGISANSADLHDVSGIALDGAGNLYIADWTADRVRKVNGNGLITTVAGNGLGGSDGDGGLATSARVEPVGGIAVDVAGNLYIAEWNRVRKVSLDGIIKTVAGNGTIGHGGDGGPATAAQIQSIHGLAVDSRGNLYIAETSSHCIRKVTPGGMITTIAGTTASGFNGDGIPAITAQLNQPVDVEADAAGNLYIADSANLRVRRIAPEGFITTVAGIPGTNGDGSLATDVPLDNPTGVAVDSEDNVYIVEARSRRVRVVSRSGVISTVPGATAWSGLRQPFGIVVDPMDRVYVADATDNRVRMFPPGGVGVTVAGNGTAGNYGDGGPATSANLRNPAGVKFDKAGNLYIIDYGNFTIRRVTPDGIIRALGNYVTPGDIVDDPYGNLYIADYGANRILKRSPDGATTIVAGNLNPGYSGDGGPATAARLSGPVGLALDVAGNLYISESKNNVIRKISTDGIIATVAGTGTAGFSGDLGPATAAQLANPGYIALDSEGNLYISDRNNNRVRKVEHIAPSIVSRFSMPGLAGASWLSPGNAPAVTVGYGRIEVDPGAPTPSGLAIFGFRKNGVLISEASVPASAPILSGRLYAESDGAVNTGIAIANTNNQAATLSFYFTGANGNTRDGTMTVPANSQIATFLDQPPLNGPSPMHGTFTFTSSKPVAVIALRGLTNERGEFLMTTLPVADLSAPAEIGPVSFPQFADGAGWSTHIKLVNPTESTLTGTIDFLDPSGRPVSVKVNGSTASSFSYVLPGRSGGEWNTSGESPSVLVGSVRVTPSASAVSPTGLTVFSFREGGVTLSEAGVPAMSSGLSFRVYVEASGDFDRNAVGSMQTGVAISNLSTEASIVTCELFRLDGSSTGLTSAIIVPSKGQTVNFLNEIPGLTSFQGQGFLRVSSTAPVSVIGLRSRYNERNDYLITTLPPLNDTSAPKPTTLVFPHFADGGGYTTQFILLNAGGQSSGVLRLFSQSGQLTPVTIQ